MDNFLQLETDSSETLAWSAKQTKLTMDKFFQNALYKKLYERFDTLLSQNDKIPTPNISNGYVYNLYKGGKHERGLWQRMSEENFLEGHSDWETLVDFDEIAKSEGKQWVYGGSKPSPFSSDLFMLGLSDGGSDSTEYRLFSVSQKKFLDVVIPPGKHMFDWHTATSFFGGFGFADSAKTESGYPRDVEILNFDGSKKLIQEGRNSDVLVHSAAIKSGRSTKLFFARMVTFDIAEEYLLEGSTAKKLPLPKETWIHGVCRDHLIFTTQISWQEGEVSFSAGDLLAYDLEGGTGTKLIMKAPSKGTFGQVLINEKDQMVVTYYENIEGLVLTLTESKSWDLVPVEIGSFKSVSPAGYRSDNSIILRVESFVDPAVLVQIKDGKAIKLKWNQKANFDSQDLKIEQYWAKSKDGTSVPYSLIYDSKIGLNKSTPLLAYAYGGFAAPSHPYYQERTGNGWLEEGRAYVIANIRGGGEFGPSWHKSAIKENRQKAYDDMIAVIEDLHNRNISSPAKTGFWGGSNGGLLAGVMLTQRPELFGAIISTVPLLDMVRYVELPPGASWISEYGDPRIPEQLEYIIKYSPYQNAHKNKKYPPVLFITSTKDNRVHPAHARKMKALMSDLGHEAYLYEESEGGHGGNNDRAGRCRNDALMYTFFRTILG